MNYKVKHEGGENCCLECGCELSGRQDKKFCSLGCKNAYNNRRIQNIRRYRSDIMSRLSKNYKILEGLLSDKVTSAPLELIKQQGFDDSCITGYNNGYRRHQECSCFDIVYCRTSSKIFGIRRIELRAGEQKKGSASHDGPPTVG